MIEAFREVAPRPETRQLIKASCGFAVALFGIGRKWSAVDISTASVQLYGAISAFRRAAEVRALAVRLGVDPKEFAVAFALHEPAQKPV